MLSVDSEMPDVCKCAMPSDLVTPVTGENSGLTLLVLATTIVVVHVRVTKTMSYRLLLYLG
jgi:hypothetical protein